MDATRSATLLSAAYLLVVAQALAAAAAPTPPAHSAAPARPAGTPIPCSGEYAAFLGTWSGEFSAYVRERSGRDRSVFRPYRGQVTYSPHDCFANGSGGGSFIVGHRVDDYPPFAGLPAKQTSELLVTGTRGDGTRFLRTVGKEGVNEFSLTYENQAAGLRVWTLRIPAAAQSPAMTYTVIDTRDLAAADSARRDVVVTLSVGPGKHPFWRGVIVRGSHTRSSATD